jgi:hypothetical protein
MHQRALDAWRVNLRANTHLRSAVKDVAVAVMETQQDVKRHDADGYMPVYLPKWGEQLGMTGQTVGNILDTLERAGALEKRYEIVPGKDGMPHKRLSIRTTEHLRAQPLDVEEPKSPRQMGGIRPGAGRKRCAECGSEDLFTRNIVELVCRNRGQMHRRQVGPDRDVNPPITTQITPDGSHEPRIDAHGNQLISEGTQPLEAQPQPHMKTYPVNAREDETSCVDDSQTELMDTSDDGGMSVSLWDDEAAFVCAVCGCEASCYTPQGEPVCDEHGELLDAG